MKYKAHFDIVAGWTPQVLQDWLEEGWLCDITVRRATWRRCKIIRVEIQAGTPEDLEAKRRAFNAMIEAKGYGVKVKET